MLYTIGHTTSYFKSFESITPPVKLGYKQPGEHPGFPSGHPGGSVWQTVEEAQKHCPVGYSVFGVLADWSDTRPSEKGDWHDLLVDAEIVLI